MLFKGKITRYSFVEQGEPGAEKPVEGCPRFEDRSCGPGWSRSSWRETVCQRKVSRTLWLLRFAEEAKSEIMFSAWSSRRTLETRTRESTGSTGPSSLS